MPKWSDSHNSCVLNDLWRSPYCQNPPTIERIIDSMGANIGGLSQENLGQRSVAQSEKLSDSSWLLTPRHTLKILLQKI